MGSHKNRTEKTVINPEKFGVSFSVKQCRNLKVDPKETLAFLTKKVGFRRFRLMSYWNEHEKNQGIYDFKALDSQIQQIEEAGGVITLCLGVRQPRWPESHWPTWALTLSPSEKYAKLYEYIAVVVDRYKNKSCIISWQLENEALNRSFGLNGDFSRKRLRAEYELVKSLSTDKPIIMSTSNTWGIPMRKPRADIFGFTFYQVQYEKAKYTRSKLPWWWYNLRAFKIALLTGKPSFIHELQAEPWGPHAIWKMIEAEQAKSLDVVQLKKNILLAQKTNLYPIDLWGGEWWYWQALKGNDKIWQTVFSSLTSEG